MITFSDLPLVREDEVYEIHRQADLYFLNQSRLTAHVDVTCYDVDLAREHDRLVDNPRWRKATSTEVRALNGWWCQKCCTT